MSEFKRVLAIETSCDDTSVAIVCDDGEVEYLLSANQNLAHESFGGIVPEIASRNHTHHLLPLIDASLKGAGQALNELDGFAVTAEPGLIGSLLVGLTTAKALSLATGKPFIGVNHLEGHLLAPLLKDKDYQPSAGFHFPFAALAVSGGHTSLYVVRGVGEYQVLGQTIDDAAGEAFDKVAKLFGLGFPGGARIDRASLQGRKSGFPFPRSMLDEEHLNFSFSGLKTSASQTLARLTNDERVSLHAEAETLLRFEKDSHYLVPPSLLADLCASFQEAVVDVLVARLDRGIELSRLERAVVTGGVSANSRLRLRALEWAQRKGVDLLVPPLRYCTDNAAMIGYAGILRLNRGESSTQSLAPEARAPLGHAPLPQNLPAWLVKARS